MNAQVAASSLYPDSRFFLDLVAGRTSATERFEHAAPDFALAAKRRAETRTGSDALTEALAGYSRRIGASSRVFAHIEALQAPGTTCVITGQQAGFLGGPAYTVYKALHAVRLAAHLERKLERRVVPVFWLASEDHDFTEINRVRWLEGADLKTLSFEWAGRGRPIESLDAEPQIVQSAEAILSKFSDRLTQARSFFMPESGDDYARWHARILSKLFAEQGLIVIEPRAIRHLTGGFMARSLSMRTQIADALRTACDRMIESGYVPSLDPEMAGRPFVFEADGRRVRWTPDRPTPQPIDDPFTYSPDAALRPILADTLFPTIASILGPGEIAYQALLLPLYRLFGVAQPVIVPRHGYTVLSEGETALLDRLAVSADEAVSSGFDPVDIAQSAAASSLQSVFDEARTNVRSALNPLQEAVVSLDPGLDARWRQAADHAQQAVDRLEERALGVEMGRLGLSRKALRGLGATLRPSGRLQERVLSFIHFALRYGVEWLPQLEDAGDPERFAHRVITIQGDL